MDIPIKSTVQNNNNGNFICVFECAMVQFTNAAWDWIIIIGLKENKKKAKTKTKQNKSQNKKRSKLH